MAPPRRVSSSPDMEKVYDLDCPLMKVGEIATLGVMVRVDPSTSKLPEFASILIE